MSYFRKVIYSFLITVIISSLFSLIANYQLLITEPPPAVLSQWKTVDVVARVGGYEVDSLTGWSSPFAEIDLNSPGLARKTTADENGFFGFYSIPLPDNPVELCLIAQDTNQLPSFPVCLPPPPQNRNIQIENVLLSPTVSLDNSKINIGETVKASGMTFPKSSIQVYFFSEKKLNFWEKIINFFKNIKSFIVKIPIYETVSNENGYFEFSLPAGFASQNRLFITSTFSPSLSQSPKSNSLSFQIMSFRELLIKFLSNLFSQVKIRLPKINDPVFIILVELLVLALLFLIPLLKKKKEKATVVYKPACNINILSWPKVMRF